MQKITTTLQRFSFLLDRAKKWFFYLGLITILVVIYYGEFLGDLRNTLLPAVAAAMLGILFETVQSLESKVLQSIKVQEYERIIDTLPLIKKLAKSNSNKVRIEIIAITGGTTRNTIIPTIMEENKSNGKEIDISVWIIDTESPFSATFPEHWEQSTKTTISRMIEQSKSKNVSVEISTYSSIPFVHGIRIDGSHLILGFSGPMEIGGLKLWRGAERPHRYFRKGDPGAEQMFKVFDQWCTDFPTKRVFSSK